MFLLGNNYQITMSVLDKFLLKFVHYNEKNNKKEMIPQIASFHFSIFIVSSKDISTA